MKIAKKFVWLAIAILPLISVVAYMAGNIGNSAGVDMIPMGTVSVTGNAVEGRKLAVEADTWGDYILTPLYGENAVGGLFGAVAGLAEYLAVNAGIPLSVPFLASLFMLCYLAVIELLSMVVDFLLFVPRKCLELFR